MVVNTSFPLGSIFSGFEYPALTTCSPKLSGPVIENQIYVAFYCEVNLTAPYKTNPDARIEVTFLFDGEPSAGVPVATITANQTKVQLHEKYLFGNLGKTVCIKDTHMLCYCEIQSWFR